MRMRTVLAALLVTAAVTASADPVKITGSLRTRVESWSFFEAPGYDDEYSFFAATLRASLAKQVSTDFDWQVEVAVPALAGLPERAAAPAPLGQLGLGGSYFAANDGDRSSISIFPKQAFVRWKRDGHSLRAGRFEFAEGGEVAPKNAMLAGVKNARVAQRLIGPFGFSHVGRSADGIQYARTTPNLNVTAAAFRPTVGAFDTNGLEEIGDVTVLYGALTYSRPNADERIFAIAYRDGRNALKTDNRTAAARGADRRDIDIVTIGGHYLAAIGNHDLLFWGALQRGDWGSLDHSAFAFDIEGGYHFTGPKKAVLRAGLFRSSGDGNRDDGEHGTFFQVLPTPRVYARFPFYNAMNSTDAFVQFSIKPTAKLTVTSEVHALTLTDEADLWYAGGGAFEEETFGFAGRPSNAKDGLANVFDVGLDYAVNPKTSVTFYAGLAGGGPVVESIFAGDSAQFLYFELTRKF